MTGDAAGARAEVDATIERLFSCAAWADKYDGAVHHTPLRNVTLAMPEAVGTIGIVCPDEAPLLAFVTLVASAIAMGNTVIAVPSERHPLAATDFYPVLETSDVPGGRREHRDRRAATSSRRCWPSTPTWTRSGTSGRRRAAPSWSARP